MSKTVETLQLLDAMLTEATQRGLLHLYVDEAALDGRYVTINGHQLVNFGSCSYLGLEMDDRLKQGAIEATWQYGTQFSSSRTYLSAPPYLELERLTAAIFGAPTVIAPSTTLAHLAALPVLISDEDAVILDQQVHQTVHVAVSQLRVQKTHVEIIRHNRMDDLEAKIVALKERYRRIWYLADGVYSMHGDFAPFDQLAALLDRYDQLHLYLDDAHGMSWTGQSGRGLTLDRLPMRPRLVVATSLNKTFGAAGGVLVFPDAELARKVKTCGGPLIFSGPIQPPMLGACLASARLHLTPEFKTMQAVLAERVALCHQLLLDHGLPVLSDSEAPVHFVGLGLPRVVYNMAERLMADGYYVNVAMFPAVPMKRAGLRFTTTLHQTPEDIRGLVEAIARHFPEVLKEEGTSMEEIHRLFRIQPPTAPRGTPSPTLELRTPPGLHLEHYTTIEAIAPEIWNPLLGANGTFDWEGLRCLEKAFQGQPEPESNWKFHYFIVRDAQRRPVLATFFTECLWKDDMLASEAVSKVAEVRRRFEPYFLTSRNLAMGSLLTEGEHLYLDRGADWKEAMRMMLAAATVIQDRCKASAVVLRDLRADDLEMREFLQQEGFLQFAEMESLVIDVDWADDEGWLAGLSHSARRHQRKKVLPFDAYYEARVIGHGTVMPTSGEAAHLHQLYRNVKARNLELNTFELPSNLFDVLAASPSWELVLLYLKPEFGGQPDGPPVAVSASFIGEGTYVPLIFGVDYDYVERHGAYRQLLRHVLKRAKQLETRTIFLGMGAAFEKTRFGARVEPRAVYYQSADHFQLEVLAQLKADAVLSP